MQFCQQKNKKMASSPSQYKAFVDALPVSRTFPSTVAYNQSPWSDNAELQTDEPGLHTNGAKCVVTPTCMHETQVMYGSSQTSTDALSGMWAGSPYAQTDQPKNNKLTYRVFVKLLPVSGEAYFLNHYIH
jgi:hypothetical protein